MKHHHDCGHDHAHDHDHSHDDQLPHELTSAAAPTVAYSGCGVSFRFPEDWSVQEESSPAQTTITVQSPGTSYWTLTLFEERPDPEHVLKSVLAAYRDLYDDLDIYHPDASFGGLPAISVELDFVCLDLVSSASIIVFQTDTQTVLVLFQGEDRELDSTRDKLESMTRSLSCDPDPAGELE